MARRVIMIKSCAVMAWGKSHSAPKGAALIFPDEIAADLVAHEMARYDDTGYRETEHATAKVIDKQTRKGGKAR